MSPSSNSSLFPPKTGDAASSSTGSRETTPSDKPGALSSPFGNKPAGGGLSSRFAMPTLKPAAGAAPLPSGQNGPTNPFAKPAGSAFSNPLSTTASSPFNKPAAPSPFSKPTTPASPSPFTKPLGTTTPAAPATSPLSRTAGTPGANPSPAFGKTTAGAAGTTGGSLFNKTPGQTSSPFGKPAVPGTATGAAGTTPASRPLSRPGQQPTFRPTALLKKDTSETPSSPFRSTSSAAENKTQPFGSLFRSTEQSPGKTAGGLPNFRPKTTLTTTATTTPFRKDLQITDEEFLQLRDFIYQQCGIFIAENRKYLVENRLSNRIKDLNLKSYSEYYNFLRFDAGRREELNKLFEVVTTNETSFFRNPPQLKVFQEYVLGEVIAACRQSGKKRIRIWSAGCSTGEEPYTLAIILHEVLKSEISSWDIKITANDLSEAVLTAARRGVYNEYALRTTPPEIIRNYFTKEGTTYKINPTLKRLVSFGQINLSDKDQLRRVEKSQIVFCRNVIIYFDDEMKRKVIGAFYDNLEPNGMLLIGHSESLHNISRAFKPEHHTGTIVYRKLG